MSEASIRDAHSPAPGKKDNPVLATNPLVNGANRVFSWLVFKIVDIVRHRAVQPGSVIATGIITNVLVIISVLSAFPWVRKSVFCVSISLVGYDGN